MPSWESSIQNHSRATTTGAIRYGIKIMPLVTVRSVTRLLIPTVALVNVWKYMGYTALLI